MGLNTNIFPWGTTASVLSIDPALTLDTKVFKKVTRVKKAMKVPESEITLVSQTLLKIKEAGKSIFIAKMYFFTKKRMATMKASPASREARAAY